MRLSWRHLIGGGIAALLVGLVLGVAIGRTQEPFGLAMRASAEAPSELERALALGISAPDLERMIEAGLPVEIVDIREPAEYSAMHIPNSQSIPLGALFARQDLIPRDRPVVVYCGSDSRDEIAVGELVKLGIANVHYLHGGLPAWQRAGLPTVR